MSSSLSIEPLFLPNDKLSNPWQKSLSIELSEDERVIDGMRTNILLDNAIHVGSTGNAENELLKQISCAKWTNCVYGRTQSSLITLTHGNRLRVYCRIRGICKNIVDISQKLNSHLKLRKWKDVEEQSDKKSIKRSNMDETQYRIISRSFFMATTAFEWSESLRADVSNIYSCLLTAQKNGLIILWKINVTSSFNPLELKNGVAEGFNIDIQNFIKPKMGMISSLDLYKLDDETSILFVGGFNGTLKAMLLKQSIKGTSHQVDLADYGLLWDDIDRLSIREVVLVDHKFEQHNRCRIVRIIVVKSCYLIVVHVKVNERNSSSEIINHAAFGTGPSNVVSVESSLKCEDEEQFIVACREGPLHILKVPSDNVASASMVTAEVSNIFFKNGDISTLDSKNYRCHGFKKSKNESLWVFLQNGLLDEQIKFSKGKLTFLTQKTFSSLSKTIFDKSNKAVMFGVPSIKDNLEVYRILACG